MTSILKEIGRGQWAVGSNERSCRISLLVLPESGKEKKYFNRVNMDCKSPKDNIAVEHLQAIQPGNVKSETFKLF